LYLFAYLLLILVGIVINLISISHGVLLKIGACFEVLLSVM
jgi:hypothetical protein